MNYKSKILSVFTTSAILLSNTSVSYAQTEIKKSENAVCNYTYVLNNTQFFDINGEITQIPSEICSLSVDITKRYESESSSSLVICAYSDSGKMSNLYVIEPDVLPGETVTERLEITLDEDVVLGDIKGYVWDSLSGMMPISNVVSIENPDDIDDPCLDIPEEEIREVITDFSDIAPDYYAAEAINLVSALGILNGYEDGTFLPDNYLTKAEASKLIVDIAGQKNSSHFMKNMNYFDDVDSSHWAAGYINYCYAKGYTAPVDDFLYQPNEYINPYEFAKMLIGAAGHNEYAKYLGGWPAGYLDVAENHGLFINTKHKKENLLTRADAAQMLYNALYMPIAEVTKLGYVGDELYVEITQMDGENSKYYKTLLTETYNVYTVEGYISETAKTNFGLAWDEICIDFTKSEKYANNTFYMEYPDEGIGVFAKYDSSEFNTDTLMEMNAKINVAGNDETGYRLLTHLPLESSVNFELSQLDTSDYEDADGNIVDDPFEVASYDDRLYFYEDDSENSTKAYKLNSNWNDELAVSVYVNGVRLTNKYSSHDEVLYALSEYVIKNDCGKIQLIDNYKTDGYYDVIYVEYYATAMVTGVSASTGSVVFDSSTTGSVRMELDEDNEEINYSIFCDGEEITVAELQKNDVLSIKFDVTAGTDLKSSFNNSLFYEIYVSRYTFNAQITGFQKENNEIHLNFEPYSTVNDYYSVIEDLTLGNFYFWNLDVFGRIYKYELDPSRDKYGVIDSYEYSSAADAYRVTMLTSRGNVESYIYDYKFLYIDGTNCSNYTNSYKNELIIDRIYAETDSKTDISQRVVYYKVSASTGKLTTLEFLPVERSSVSSDIDGVSYAEFKSRTNSIGAIKINKTKTKFINVVDYAKTGDTSTMTLITLDDLIDDNEYGAYAYGSRFTDGTYPLVVITSGEFSGGTTIPETPTEPDVTATYNEETRLAVVKDAASEYPIDEKTYYEIPVFYEGEEKTLLAEDSISSDVLSLQRGDVFFFTTNSDDCINKLDVVFTLGGIPTYAGLLEKSLVTKNDTKLLDKVVFYPDKEDCSGEFAENWDCGNGKIQLIYGPVIEKGSNYMSIGKLYGNNADDKVLYTDMLGDESDAGGCYFIDFGDTTNVYTFDYSIGNKDLQMSIGTTGSITESSFTSYYLDDDGDTIPWNKTIDETYEEIDFSSCGNYPNLSFVNFAFALVVDGEAVDVFTFIAP